MFQGLLSFDPSFSSLLLAFRNLPRLKDWPLPAFQAIFPALSKQHPRPLGPRGTAPSSVSACPCVYVWVHSIFLFSALTCEFPKADGRWLLSLFFSGFRPGCTWVAGSPFGKYLPPRFKAPSPLLSLCYPYHVEFPNH